MSYSIDMCFKHIDELRVFEKEALGFVKEVSNLLLEPANFDEFVKNNDIFFPSRGKRDERQRKLGLLDKADKYYLWRLLTQMFVFYPKLRLVALVGSSYPKAILDKFDCICYFQNSCDQDYNFDSWKGIEAFEKIARFAQYKSIYKIREAARKIDYFDEETISYWLDSEDKDVNYFRRFYAYKAIEELVFVDDVVYEKANENFYVFHINSLKGSYQACTLEERAANALTEELYEDALEYFDKAEDTTLEKTAKLFNVTVEELQNYKERRE